MFFREEIGESLTLKFAAAAAERRKKGLPIISLGLGEPDFEVPDQIVQATIKTLQTQKAGYSDPMGILALREKISGKLKKENFINSNANNILVSAGAKQAFQQVCMALLEPGDEVIIINPSFVSFIPQIYIAEPQSTVKVIDVNKTDFSFPVEAIKSAISSSTKLLVINSPNNPAGYVASEDQLKALYNLAELHNFYILSDEIYEKLIFSGLSHFSIGSLEQEPKRVITINGFSKSHAMTGWRLGYACFPIPLRNKLLKLQQHMHTNTCTFIQQAVAEAFDIKVDYLAEYNGKLASRLKLVEDAFSNMDKVSLVSPLAGFFAFLNIVNTGIDSNTFCGKLIEETGVATTPGIAFGKNWDDHIRISFATNEHTLEQGLSLLRDFILKNH